MENQNENKRLVLIGIRRKGENGFKTQVDTRAALNQRVTKNETPNIPFVSISNSNQTLNPLTD